MFILIIRYFCFVFWASFIFTKPEPL